VFFCFASTTLWISSESALVGVEGKQPASFSATQQTIATPYAISSESQSCESTSFPVVLFHPLLVAKPLLSGNNAL
jgi:hypothetical protein